MLGRFLKNRALTSQLQRNMVMATVPRANFGKYHVTSGLRGLHFLDQWVLGEI